MPYPLQMDSNTHIYDKHSNFWENFFIKRTVHSYLRFEIVLPVFENNVKNRF